jgi:hypothetical protein
LFCIFPVIDSIDVRGQKNFIGTIVYILRFISSDV